MIYRRLDAIRGHLKKMYDLDVDDFLDEDGTFDSRNRAYRDALRERLTEKSREPDGELTDGDTQ